MSTMTTYFQTFTTDAEGQISLTGIVSIGDFEQVNLEITQYPKVAVTMNVVCSMGKISGPALSHIVGQFALGTASTIHTFDVVGPEFSVVLTGGPPNVDVPIQGWLFLR